jgi:hypothetical protein
LTKSKAVGDVNSPENPSMRMAMVRINKTRRISFIFPLTNECVIIKKEPGARGRGLSPHVPGFLLAFGPFGFCFVLRLNYQADGGDDCKKRF